MQVKQQYRVRSYISFSQMECWEKGQYTKKYLMGETPSNKYQRFGTKLHEALIEPTKDPNIEKIKMLLPNYAKREVEIKATAEGIPLLGRIDGLNVRQREFCDFKTGKKFSQSQADRSTQITFYWLLLWKKYGWLPKRAFIHWIETSEKDGNVYPTGKVQTFEIKRNMQDLMLLFHRVKESWVGIGALCDEFFKKII